MNHWLKLIGSSYKPITEHQFYGNYDKNYIGFRRTGKPSIQMGDHIFLYAPGRSRSIFALAEATTDPERDVNYNSMEEGSCQWQLRIHYLINLLVTSGIPIDEVSSKHRNLTKSVRQQSHIKLTHEEYKLIYRKLQEQSNQ